MFKRMVWLVVLASGVMFSSAQAAGLEMAVGGWQQLPGGSLSYEALSKDDVIDLEENLGFDKESRVFGRVRIDLPLFFPNIYLVAAPMEFEGTGSKSVSVKFGDVTFDENAILDSKVTMNQYDIGFFYDLPFVHTATAGILNIDLGINIRIIDFEASIHGEAGGITDEAIESLTIPVPMLYIAFQVMPTKRFAFEAEGRGIAIGDNNLYSITSRLRWNLAGPAFVAAGYRFDKLDIDEDEVVVDTEFRGPFLELGLKF